MDDTLNPYTGQASVLAIMERIRRGEATWPRNMGETIRPPQASPIVPPGHLPGWIMGRNGIRPV